MAKAIKRYRFPSGARLATGPSPSVVPSWAPTQLSVPVTRQEAAAALQKHRKLVTRITLKG